MSKIYYSKEHEWVQIDEGDSSIAKVGITDHAQDSLGEIVYVDLPELGTQVNQQAELAVVESAKAASDIYAPVSGEVIAVNEQLEDSPNLINSNPMDDGWLFSIKLSDRRELEGLFSKEEYNAFLNE